LTHYRQLYDRDYLGSWDLPENKDVVVTIEKAVGGELTGNGGKKAKKPIISFVGKEKKFVVNVTNAKAIAGLYGNHVEKWAGKRIALYVSTTRDPSTGGDIPCIRVRPQAPAAAPSSSAPAQAPAEEVQGNGAPI
jgi:hypothetical protein